MKVTIENNILESNEQTFVIALASMFAEGKYSNLSELLCDDCMLVRKDKGTIFGKNNIISYFQDWSEKISEKAELIVKWLPYNTRPNILIKYLDNSNKVILL